jgi:ankyrin repeat protein
MTELHDAVAECEIERVRQLIAAGADVNARDEDGATPLHYAGAERHIDIIRLLLDAGADLSSVDEQGKTAEDWAYCTSRGDSTAIILLMGLGHCLLPAADQPHACQPAVPPEPSALERAIQEDDLGAVGRLLEHGAPPEGADRFWDSPIITAVLAHRPKVVEFLVKRGVDPNLTNEHGETLLHQAAWSNDPETVRTLIRLGAQINVAGGDDHVLTPLQVACREGDVAIARLLLEMGADPNLTKHLDGWSALHFAVFDNQAEIIKVLLEYGADVFVHDGWHTPLDSAIRRGKREEASILYRAVEEKYPAAYGIPLHAAANKGDTATVEALINSGAGINDCDYLQKTPLNWAVGEHRPLLAELILEFHKVESASDAAQLSQKETIKVLIEHGADIEAQDVHGDTPLIEATGWGQEDAARVLIEAAANVNAQDLTGWTPLLYAAAGGRVETIRLLISKGANLQIVRNGWNALTYASHHGRLEAAKLFIAEGAPINPPVELGTTPLHSAAFMGHREIVSLLLANGADRNAKDDQGRTPSDRAKERKQMAVVKMLRED